MIKFIDYEIDNKEDDFCFTMMLRTITNLQRSGARSFSSFQEKDALLWRLVDEVKDTDNHPRVRYEALWALTSTLENSKTAFKLLNAWFKSGFLDYNWYNLINDYIELTSFKFRVHPDTIMTQQMDFILTVQRRGLMWWEDDDSYKDEKLR